MASVPYTFANQSGSIPLAELDANFAAIPSNTAPGPIGSVTSSTGAFTTLTTTGNESVGGNLSVTGFVFAGASPTQTFHSFYSSGSLDATAFRVFGSGTSKNSIIVSVADVEGFNAAVATVKVGRTSTSGRSINAGGTINASGADYAKQARRNASCALVSKGQIVGFDADGRITDKWDDVRSTFGIVSTDPSFVDNDREYDASEDEMWCVIACAGWVPCNVCGAVGDWIVPVQDGEGMAGVAIADADLTFDQHRRAVGRVRRILADGRCEVSV